MNFGKNLPKIVWENIEIDFEDFRTRITTIKKKQQAKWQKFEDDFGTDHSYKLGNRNVIEFDLLSVSADEWATFASFDGKDVNLYYHGDLNTSNIYKCDITGFHNADWFLDNSIHIKLTQKHIQSSINTVTLYGLDLSPVIGI